MPNESTARQTEAETEEVNPLRDPLGNLGSLPAELRRLVHDQLQLAALEFRLAGRSLTAMISAAVFMGALLLLTWIALLASAGFGLSALGLPPAVVMLVLAVLTMGLVWLLRLYIHRRSADLGFPGTVRSLKPAAANPRKPEGQ